MKLEAIVFREQIFWGQKAKMKWIKEGDISSKLFQKVVVGKRKKKFIKIFEVGTRCFADRKEQIVGESLIVSQICIRIEGCEAWY